MALSVEGESLDHKRPTSAGLVESADIGPTIVKAVIDLVIGAEALQKEAVALAVHPLAVITLNAVEAAHETVIQLMVARANFVKDVVLFAIKRAISSVIALKRVEDALENVVMNIATVDTIIGVLLHAAVPLLTAAAAAMIWVGACVHRLVVTILDHRRLGVTTLAHPLRMKAGIGVQPIATTVVTD